MGPARPSPPERVFIVGGSGSGKTTLARHLGYALELPVYDLDQVARIGGGNGPERPLLERVAAVGQILESKRWIVEGIHLGWTDQLLQEADVIVWLDHLSWRQSSGRIIRRFIGGALTEARGRPPWQLFRPRDYARHLRELLLSVRGSRDYHMASGSDTSGAESRARTIEHLEPHRHRLVHCRTPSDVRAFQNGIARGVRRGRPAVARPASRIRLPRIRKISHTQAAAHRPRGVSTGTGRNLGYRLQKVKAAAGIFGGWLDCGCAEGWYTVALLQVGAHRVVGVDVESARIARARHRWRDVPSATFEVASAEALPFADGAFDGVLMNEVLEHVDDEVRSLREIWRVLRPGGHVAIMVPNRLFPFEGHGLRLGPYRIDTPVPVLPWLPEVITRPFTRARNYWPWQLEELVCSQGFDLVRRESVFPVFEVHPWLPGRVQQWYWRNLPRLERSPILNKFGVSTLLVAQKPGDETSKPSTS